MIDPFPAYERLPFRPGEAPFRIKGQAYRGHIAYTELHVPGGMKAAVAALRDPALRAFFDQQFLAASFYDVYPLIAMGWVCARLAGTTFPEFLRIRTRAQVDFDMGGVYKLLLKLASLEMIAAKIPVVSARYFDFGTVDIATPSPKVVEATRREIPATIAPWLGPIGETYVIRALERSGAKNPRARLYPFRADGERFGVEVGSMKCEWSWD
jgi:hypothetical protein